MQALLVAGSVVALVAAIGFLSIGIIATLRTGKSKAIYAYVFFVLSMLILALYMFLWHSEFGRVGQEVAATGATTSQNLSPLWLSAIGTTLLAMMTFIVSILLPWWRQPRFTIEFDNKEPYCRKLDAPQSYWLRLKVTNSGKSVARTCSGRLVKFIGNSGEVEGHDLVQLHWINTLWSPQELFRTIDLNQGEHDFLDILVTRPEHQGKALLFMSVDNLFGDKPEEVPQGTCRIQVTVYGDNVKPCAKEYSITWEGSNYTDIRLEEK